MSDENENDVLNEEQQQETGVTRTADKAKGKAGEETKKFLKKAKEGQEKGKYASGFAKAAYYIVGAIIIIVMAIGFISFAINMPGTIVEKIMNFGTETAMSIKAWFSEKDLSTRISYDDKLKMINYIDDMGYDVVGMGFVQSIHRDSNGDIDLFEEDITRTDTEDSEAFDKEKRNDSVQPSYLFSYILADTRVYAQTHINGFNTLFKNTGADDTWGQGMLNIYGDMGLFDDVEIDRENLTLTFKNTNGFLKTDAYQYNIDGWAGRYGTPIELLLTLHASTMMPDLVYEFISNDNLRTQVNILAKEVELYVNLKLDGPDGEVDLNIGSKQDQAIPINFIYDSNTKLYGISNKDEIINGLKNGTYSVASLYKAFENLLGSFNDFYSQLGEQNTKEQIQKLVQSDGQTMYLAKYNIPDTFATYFLGDYIGIKSEVEGAKEINGLTVNSYDPTNRTIELTFSANGAEFKENINLVEAVPLDKFEETLTEGKQLINYANEIKVDINNGEGRDNIRSYYGSIFTGIDTYFENLLVGNSVVLEGNLNYNKDNSYYERFSKWINAYQPLSYTDYLAEHPEYSQYHDIAKQGYYNNYLKTYAGDKINEYNEIIEDIKEDVGVREDTTAIAQSLKESLSAEIGLTAEQVDIIYNSYVLANPEIKTFVPGIQSVVKHWYKDIVFQYDNVSKGTIFVSEYPGECVPGYKLYYEFTTLNDDYPIQDGEPYVIKGDAVTRGNEVIDTSNGTLDIELDENTKEVLETENYTLGDGYKTARKLFTQGWYYQYDGTNETAKEIAVAKRIESYNEGEKIRVVVENGKLIHVRGINSDDDGVNKVLYRKAVKTVDANGNSTIEYVNVTPEEATRVTAVYYIEAPMKYVSPADGDNTLETVESINNTLASLGTKLRRKQVNIMNNTTTLNALAMLEGMHSLDADYIYRDFKEFMIELGYYSRAELEAVETDILDWFIPGFQPDQWPPIKDDILEYGITVKSSVNIGEEQIVDMNKISSLDNFIFFQDISGVMDLSTLQQNGQNVKMLTISMSADAIVNNIINSKANGIVLYMKGSAEDNAEEQATKMKKLLENIRTKLEEKEYEVPNLPIYVMQILPLKEPDVLDKDGTEQVNKNQEISNYNTKLYNICLNQENIRFIDTTTGCVNSNGWLSSDFSNKTVSENIINKIVNKNATNGGFKDGLTVITPGAGYVTNIEDVTVIEKNENGEEVETTVQQITIEFSVEQDPALKAVDKFSIIIKGIAIDEELKNNFNSSTITDEDGNKVLPIEKRDVIGVTTTSNIQLILRDKNNAILNNIEDYMPISTKNHASNLGDFEQITEFILTFEGGINSNVEGDCWIVIPDSTDPDNWRIFTAGGSGITNWCEKEFKETGHGDLWPMELGDRVPIADILEVKAKVLEGKFEQLDELLENHGITDWGFDQKAAFVSLMYNGFSGKWNDILSAYANGNIKQFVNLWMNCYTESVQYGHQRRRAVELDLFFTGNYEVTEARILECYRKYLSY